MKTVFVAFDPPMPPTGGGTRTYHMLKAVAEVSACQLLVCFPGSPAELPLDVQEGCASIDVSTRSFRSAIKGRFGKWFHQFRMAVLPFTMSAESIVRLADYYLLHPSESRFFFKRTFYQLIRLSLFRQAKKIYAAGYRYPARTLERMLQYNELEPKLKESLATADLLWIDFSYAFPFFEWVKQKHPAVKLICNAHNLEYLFLERMAAVAKDEMQKKWLLIQAKVMKEAELEGFKQCDQVIVCSDADHKVIKELLPSANVNVLPNGVDLSYFQPSGSEQVFKPIILFTGTMNYAPNQDAVHYFIHSVFPKIREKIPNCKFIVAGANAAAVFPIYSNMEGVELVSSPADMRPYYNKANVVVVPLRSGSGTRLKILEAVAMKKPVISTSVGAEGLNFCKDAEIFIADTQKEFAEKIVALLLNPFLAVRLTGAAHKKAELYYDWNKIRESLKDQISYMSFNYKL